MADEHNSSEATKQQNQIRLLITRILLVVVITLAFLANDVVKPRN